MSTVEKSMGRTVDITTLPNHINNEHVHIFRWLDGCGWTIKCGNIHIESSNIEDAIMDFLKFTSELDMSIEDMDQQERWAYSAKLLIIMGISIEMFKFYEVGGKIRDELLGLTNKDVDYVAVPTEACYSSIHPRALLLDQYFKH